ncbi:chloride channel protein [Fructobacillus sp. M1-13]|uniref:Chloride channel protein n=1 Tax=Fructobacillus papyriferae TaxID=2713171 RepID=A0ABS5QQQ1_9LACO|nr:chloride channel protein [Fructobacillus papyriferae]MBS9335445.1 chloride channel protein [Fructobacillus papyriferae]MCD2159215.1 chloride channel protein [Fructobacillus papyriferae]
MNSSKQQEIKALVDWRHLFSLLFTALFLAVVIGLSAMFLSYFLDIVADAFMHFHESYHSASPKAVPSWRRLLSVTVGGLIAGMTWYLIRRKDPKIVGIKGAMKGQKMPLFKTILNVLTQIFYVGTGGSVGRELAPRQLGVMISQQVQDFGKKRGFLTLTNEDRQLLLAAAAGAGFAGVYIAPITGMLFSVELLLKKNSIKNIAVSLLMSIIACLIGALAKGFTPYYWVASADFSRSLLLAAVVIGPLAGITGAWAKQAFSWAQKKQATGKTILLTMPLVGLLTGLIAYFVPEIMGNGRAVAQLAFHQTSGRLVFFFLALGLLKFGITFLTLYGGGTGGTLTPSIALGAVLGLVVAVFFAFLLPGIQPWHFALIGAVALLAASQQAPLMAMFMVFEIAHLHSSALLIFATAVALSSATSNFYLKVQERKLARLNAPE